MNRRLWLALGVTLLFSCDLGAGPDAIARNFWEAVRAGDLERAAEYTSGGSARPLRRWGEAGAIEELRFGDTLSNERRASTETSLLTKAGDFELRVQFETRLVREAGLWKVDVERTREELSRGLIAAGMASAEHLIAEGLHELGEALELGAREAREALEEALEGLVVPEESEPPE